VLPSVADENLLHLLGEDCAAILNGKSALPHATQDSELGKGELLSRLLALVEKLKPFCEGDEAELLEKAAKSLDVTAFATIQHAIVARVQAAA